MTSPAWLPPEVQQLTANGSNTATNDSTSEPSQANSVTAPGGVIPQSSFSFQNSEGSGHSASFVINSNPSVPPDVSSFSYSVSQTAVGYSPNQQFQPNTNKLEAVEHASLGSSTSINSQPVQVSVSTFLDSTVATSSATALSTTTSWMPTIPSFPTPTGLFVTPQTQAPPGLLTLGTKDISSAFGDYNTSAGLRPSVPTPSAPSNSGSAVQHPIYPTYPSLPPIGVSPQGPLLQPPQMGVRPWLPFLPYPAAYPSPFPLPALGMPHPSVSQIDGQPPGVSSVRTAAATSTHSAIPGLQLVGTSGMNTEAPASGIDKKEHVHDVSTKVGASVNEQFDAWTAHKTDTGIVYYYNAVTGESTYEKPAGFKGETDKVPVQPTPVSMEYLTGTDWALVTTNDGKKYYYNSKMKVSSWQIPTEVTELKKKEDDGTLKEQSVPNTNIVIEKGSNAVSLSAPAVNTGGRDATALRTSSMPGSSSALDLIKKKLQDSGIPTASPASASSAAVTESNGSKAVEVAVKGLQNENVKDKLKDINGDGNMSDSSSDSEDGESGPTKEECIIQFKEMLKERGVAPFSKWEKELPKIVFDPRFKAIPSQSARRALFERYVKTRAEEERKEKRAAQKAAIEGFKQLLEEVSEDIDHSTDYQTFRKKWSSDPRFEALDRKDRELLLNERVLPLKRAAEEKVQAIRAAAASSFKSMLREKGDITLSSRWSKVKDILRDDPRYKSVKHEDREVIFNEYVRELKAAEEEAEREAKARREEQEKLKERERELRKRKEREEQEMERVRLKVRRKEVVTSFQALLVETIKDPQASWTESRPKLEKDPQGRATNPDLDPSDREKLFREHIKMLYERCAHDFRGLLTEVITAEAAAQETEDRKTVLNSWSTAKRLLKPDPRYNKMPRKEREALWRRYAEEMQRKHKSSLDQNEDNHKDSKSRSSTDGGRPPSSSRRNQERR